MANILDLGELKGMVVVFGGTYGNLEALVKFLAIMQNSQIPASNIIHSGDIAAYGAEPEECAFLLRETGCHAIKGNVEEQLGKNATDCGCGFDEGSTCDTLSSAWYPYVNARISDETRVWMNGLPDQLKFSINGFQFLVVHGGVREVNTFNYPSTQISNLRKEMAAAPDVDVVVAGHTGFPMMRLPEDKLWHNTGAIGIPANDGTPRGWFSVIYQTDDNRLCFDLQAMDYDHASAAQKIRAAGLPEAYATALETGIVPNTDTLPMKEQAVKGIAIEPQAFVWPPLSKS